MEGAWVRKNVPLFVPVVRQKTVRTSLAPLVVTRIDRQRAFSARTRSDFESRNV